MDKKVDLEVVHLTEESKEYRITVVGDASSSKFVELTSSLEKSGFPFTTLMSTEEWLKRDGDLAPTLDVLFLVAIKPCATFFDILQDIQQKSPCAVLMISDDSTNQTIEKATRNGAHGYLTEIPTEDRMEAVISAAIARFKLFHGMHEELHSIKQTLKERKIVERAKGILMNRKSLDEASAYRAMQKMAMNRNVKLVELAQSMISASELLD